MATYTGNNGNNHITGSNGADTIYGLGGDDTLSGGNGNDLIDGGAGDDDIDGGNGNDTIVGGAGDDLIDGGNGDDHLDGGDDDDIVHGGNGADTLLGGAGDDALFGENGNDHLTGGAGDDLIDGGNGFDIACYAGPIGEYSFFSAAGYLHVLHQGGAGTDGHDRLIRVERLVFADRVIEIGNGTNKPVAADDHVSIDEDVGSYSSGAASVKDNDFDFDGDALTVTGGTFVGAYGTLTLNANGTYSYTLNAAAQALAEGEVVSDSFNYSVSDNDGSDTGTLVFHITGLNDAPVASADADTTGENAALLVDVLANDSDVDNGAVLTVTAASAAPGEGSASVVGNQVQFDPGSDFDYLAVGESALVVIDYTVEDEHGASSSSTLTVTVTGTNDAPTIDAGGTDAFGAVAELPNDDPGENTVSHGDSGTIAFDDLDLADTHSASFAPHSGGYLGTFALDPVDQGGDSVGWTFTVDDAELDFLDDGETLIQTYTVEIDDGNGGTVTQDVSITLTGASDGPQTEWYIDNSAVGSTNVGTAGNPFTSIAAFNAAQGAPGGPQVGATVYLLAGTGTYAEDDGINLLDDQSLVGVSAGPVRPTIVTTGGTNHGIELAQNNTVSGVDLGDTTGAGIADGGGSVGTLTITDVGKSGAGQIVDIDEGGTLDVTLTSAESTGSSGAAIDLADLAGSFTVTGAVSITGVHGDGAVDITGGSLASTFQSLTIATSSGFGLNAQDTGSVTIAGGAIATSGAGAVNLTNAASGGIALSAVSSTGGTASGVVLVNAGAGGFTVTGSGSAGSGGTISGKTGLDGVFTTGTGIYLANTANVSLAELVISNNANGGIVGFDVDGFALTDSTFSLGNGSHSGEGSIAFSGLTGTATLLGNVIGGSAGDHLRIENSGGALDLTIADSAENQAIFGLNNNASGLDGVFIETAGSASLALLIDGVEFQGSRSDLVHINADDNSAQTIVIANSSFNNFHPTSFGGGVVLTGGGPGSDITVDYRVEDNVFSGAVGNAITAYYLHQAGTVRGYIARNAIGVDDGAIGAEGSLTGDGIVVGLEKADGAGDAAHYAVIVDNQVRDIDGGLGAITVRASGGTATDTATVEAIVSGNVIEHLGPDTLAAFYALVGGAGSDFAALGLEMDDNLFDGTGTLLNAVFLDQISPDAHYYFPGYAGSPDGEFLGGTASADLDAYLSGRDNVMINGLFPSFPGGVDGGLLLGVTGDVLLPAWYP